MGGSLELRAAFPNGEVVKLNQFDSLTAPRASRAKTK
jgi:hypothetical protein